jgi:polyribonucleotide nucleotidyltransferase
MCHISELAEGRVESVGDVCQEGDDMEVMVVNVDERSGKIRLSRRVAMLPEDQVEEAIAAAAKPMGGGRGGDRGGRGGGRDRDRGRGRDSRSGGGRERKDDRPRRDSAFAE